MTGQTGLGGFEPRQRAEREWSIRSAKNFDCARSREAAGKILCEANFKAAKPRLGHNAKDGFNDMLRSTNEG